MPNYLYLLVRNDMASLGRGKSVAQGAHAANAFTWDHIIAPSINQGELNPEAMAWCTEADGFGTTIALSANLQEIEDTVMLARALGFPARVVADPEYPLMDGKTFHIIPNVVTGAYVFGDKERLGIILKRFKLLENDPINGQN